MHETDNCSNLESDGCSTVAEYSAYLYVYSPVCLLGVILNALVLVVLDRGTVKNLHASTGIFLMGLAWLDLLCLALSAPLGFVRCLPYTHEWEKPMRSIYEAFLFKPLANTLSTGSVWLTVIISVERLLFVKHWLLAKRLCVQNFAPKLILAIITICAFGISVPYFFYQILDEDGNLVKTEFGDSFGFYCYLWARLVFVKFLPIILATIFNILLLVAVKSARTQVERNVVMTVDEQGRRHGQQMRLVSLVVAISAVFVACNVLEPFFHPGIYGGMFGECALDSDLYRIMRVVTNILEMFSLAINFVLLWLFNNHFRMAAKQILCCCCLHNRVDPTEARVASAFPECVDREERTKIDEYDQKDRHETNGICEVKEGPPGPANAAKPTSSGETAPKL